MKFRGTTISTLVRCQDQAAEVRQKNSKEKYEFAHCYNSFKRIVLSVHHNDVTIQAAIGAIKSIILHIAKYSKILCRHCFQLKYLKSPDRMIIYWFSMSIKCSIHMRAPILEN